MCRKHTSPQIRNKPTGIVTFWKKVISQSPLKCPQSPQNLPRAAGRLTRLYSVSACASASCFALEAEPVSSNLTSFVHAHALVVNQRITLRLLQGRLRWFYDLRKGYLGGRGRRINLLEGGLLALEAATTGATPTATTSTEATTAATTSTAVVEASTAAASTATAEAAATATAGVWAGAGEVQTQITTHQISTLELLDDRPGVLNRVEGDVTEALETSGIPIEWSARVKRSVGEKRVGHTARRGDGGS